MIALAIGSVVIGVVNGLLHGKEVGYGTVVFIFVVGLFYL